MFHYVCFLVCFMVLWVMFKYLCFIIFIASCLCWTCKHPYAIVLHWMHVRRSFALLCDHCSHFFMIFLVYGQFAHIFYILFTWTQFNCYIILVLLLLALPWRFNVFCASVSSYRYICSKFIIAPMIHDRGSDMIRGEREKEFCVILTMFFLCS